MNNISNISYYQPRKDDKFFFDTNIWIYLYYPLGNYNKNIISKYSNFLKQILKNQSRVFISSIVLSEFINTYVRLEFNILKKKYPNKILDFKKDFRGTKKYRNVISDIKITLKRQILKFTQRIDDKFNKMDIDELLLDLENSDFNDNYYICLCEIENLKIVTHDKDFKSKATNIPILTANSKLLMTCVEKKS